MKNRNKNNYSIHATNISLFSKIIIVVLVIGMILGHINFSVFASAFRPKYNEEITIDNNQDISSIRCLGEDESLRTSNSKTYIKENGSLELEYYPEEIHYLENGVYKEIDNTLKLVDNNYTNTHNKYNVMLPTRITDNNKVIYNYQGNIIKIFRNLNSSNTIISNINKNTINLKDEISYKLNNNETIKYKVSQSSIEEDVILNNYISNYAYEYFIETPLRIERVGNNLEFYNDNTKVFVMDEYVMYDSLNNKSNDIDFKISLVSTNVYKIEVTPSDDYLKAAAYPVVIDPEITIIDGGLIDGAFSVTTVDELNNTTVHHSIGSFTINNRINSNLSDDIKAYFNVLIPQYYNTSLVNALLNNQFMYAYVTLPTISINRYSDTIVNLKYEGEIVASDIFHSSNVFNHKFDVYNVISNRIDELANSDLNFTFELTLDGTDDTSITYSLGGDLTGPKPILTLGYMSEAGLADYYTYESFNLGDGSTGYIAHNSGNLTYLYSDISDNLLNLTHIYNVNRMNENSKYGKGFSINYNEKISTFYYDGRLELTLGDGRNVLFSAVDSTSLEFIANDGSLDKLTKKLENNILLGYEIETSSGNLKVYDVNGYLIKVYQNVLDKENGVWNEKAKYVELLYDENYYLRIVKDNYNNKLELDYNFITGKLTRIDYYKYDETNSYVNTISISYTYNDDKLTQISKTLSLNNDIKTIHTIIDYDKFISRISINNKGYTFQYDLRNRITEVKVYSSSFTNGTHLTFDYDTKGKRTTITDSSNRRISYTFDKYYHTNSVTDSNGYTTFYKYNDIYYDESGNTITSPNYNLNHKINVSSNNFKNTINQVTNHGFEIVSSSDIYGWTKEVTGSSNAQIETNSYLYGSKVLDLKKGSGPSKVYQEINVEEGIEYIVSGYIKNVNNGTGAYINVTPISGTFSNISSSQYIKSTTDFVRFEYKFTSNYTGCAKLYLVNESTGHSYFDQIQVNTNYVDTRYNYLENSSFEKTTSAVGYEFPNSVWNHNNAIVTNKQPEFDNFVGNKNLLLGKNGYVSQTINTVGLKDDIFVFGGYALYENYTGRVKISLTINYIVDEENNTSSDTISFIFDDATLNARYMMNKLVAKYNYSSITLKVENESLTSYAYVDNLSVFKEGYGINVSYTDEGMVSEEYNEVTDEVTSYEYDENNNLTTITTNEKTTNIEYNDNNSIDLIEKENVTNHFEYDEYGNVVSTNVDTTDSTNSYSSGSTTYSSNGLFPTSQTDILGNTTNYAYDILSGLVKEIIRGDGYQENYTYDAFGNILTQTSGTKYSKQTITYTYDVYGNITSISNGSLIYSFTYNNYGDIKTIKINNNVIVTNNYENENSSNPYTENLVSSTYSYGTISFTYYEDGNIKEVYYNNSIVLSYIYNDYGEIASYNDYREDVTYYYNYDYQNRLININATNGRNITYTYDCDSNLVSKTNILGTNSYTYNDSILSSENISNKFNTSYTYSNDSFKNLSIVSYYINNNQIDINYTNETITTPDNETLYTGRVKEVTYTNNNSEIIKYVYEYDNYTNNITKIEGYTNNILVYSEENYYDKFNQLNVQFIYANNTYYMYECGYDTRGNIVGYYLQNQTTRETINSGEFTYNINNELVATTINGVTYNMTYSSIGFPSSYLGWNITYYMNQITSITKGNSTVYYSYNANGIRTYKEVIKPNGTSTTSYILEGNKIIGEIRNNTNIINYYYDSNENLVGFTYNNVKYLYLKNLQNDVIGIVDETGNTIVKYYYDGYGTIIDVIDTSGINLSSINPFRYRSYYQDDETGWYYLNSRYYDPLVKRFITMDDISYLGASGTVLSYNLFSYCENNPVNNVDKFGSFAVGILSSSLIYQLSGTLSGLIASTASTIASIKSAIATAWLPILALALVAVAIIGIVYAVNLVKNLIIDANRAKSFVNSKVKSGGISEKQLNNYTVYVIVKKGTTDVHYVGMTKNFSSRKNAHNKGKFPKRKFDMIPIVTGLSRADARALEQALITAFTLQALENMINSIAMKNWGKFTDSFGRVTTLISNNFDGEY